MAELPRAPPPTAATPATVAPPAAAAPAASSPAAALAAAVPAAAAPATVNAAGAAAASAAGSSPSIEPIQLVHQAQIGQMIHQAVAQQLQSMQSQTMSNGLATPPPEPRLSIHAGPSSP